MKSKLLVFIVSFMCIIAVIVFPYSVSYLNATSTSTYINGGEITGRINKMPSDLSSSTSGLQKGDRVLTGVANPLYPEENIAFQLIKNFTYTDYGCLTPETVDPEKVICSNEPLNAWLSATTKEIGVINSGLNISDLQLGKYVIDWKHITYGSLAESTTLVPLLQSITDAIKADNTLLTYRNMTRPHENYEKFNPDLHTDSYDKNNAANSRNLLFYSVFAVMRDANVPSDPAYKNFDFMSDKLFIMGDGENGTENDEHALLPNDRAFNKTYFSGRFYNDSYGTNPHYVIGLFNTNGRYMWSPSNSLTNSNYKVNIRPYAYLKMEDTVFAVSKGSERKIGTVTLPYLPSDYTNIFTDSTGAEMKLRMENTKLTGTTSLSHILNNQNQNITEIMKNKTVYLDASAVAGDDGNGGVYTVSAIVFDQNNNFVFYKPLETAKGSGKYEFDLTGIEAGSYRIGIVNEAYNENSLSPCESSLITATLPLEIVEPVSIGVAAKTGLEYSENVNMNDVVATYTTSNGVAPITITLISDSSVSGHSNDYKMFSLSNGNVVVNDPNGLNAGDYYFKLNVKDSNGDPAGGVNSSTVHINVAKTGINIAFDDPTQTKKSINEAAASWSETATATPGSGTKITYAITGGDFGLIDINTNTGSVRYKGNGDYGKVTITATVDDDPASGNDNYNPASVEKDIIIYKEVEGVITPASGSSDNTIPTFTANQANVQANGKIAKITGMPGSPTPIDGSNYKYTYGITSGGNASFFAVDPNTGDITTKGRLSIGEYHFNVTVSDGWSTKEIAVTVKVEEANAEPLYFYETSAAINMITRKSVVLTEENVVVYATVKGSSNPNPVKYRISDGSTDVIEVNETSGAVTIHGVGTVTIVAEKQGISGQANAQAELTFTVTAGAQNFIYTDNAGNELPKSGNNYTAKTEIYEPSKTFQLYTAGNPTGSTVTYQLKAGSPTDVISVDGNGLVTVLNASISPSQIGRVIVEATSHDPTGNYSDKIIELPINITKANQTISFKEITYVSNGKGSVAPIINEQDISSSEGGVSVPDTNYYISVDTSITNNIAYTNDGITIHYDYTGEDGIDIPLHVVKAGNRNYEKAEADGTLHIMSPDENILATTNMGKIVYGDHFEIRSLQDDSSSTNVQYQFEVDNTTYISNPTVSGNKAEFDALKVSGKTNITIKVTRTADGETPLSKNISVQVLPKEIEITIDDQEKLKGEPNPTLTYQDFRSELVTWNGVQDTIQENDIKISTTAKTDSNAGSYPIKGDSNTLNKTYPNYSFSFKEGTLTIKEENIEDDWYHLEIDDGNNTAYTGNWTNQNVNIISDHNEYINLSLDQSTWKPTKVTVSKEGETNQSFWMKKDNGAITKEKHETIRIDKTAPKVKGIKAKDTNNKLQDIINKLSGGIFFKPGTAFEITTDDSKDDLKVSGTKEIAYKVYKVEQQARTGDELIKEGKLTVTNEKASITISETTGNYKVCVIPSDNAGNTNTESCHEVELKKIDVDVDKDGKPDFNDPNGDGCPDLNIKWKDSNDPSKWIVINGDRDGDGIPDLNIDSDGDGKPDLNIDTDHDGKPDLNLVILKKSDWKPTKCVKANIDSGILEEYCTGTSVKAVINVDTDNDAIPNINVDNKGDFKPHLNISKDGKIPFTNIVKLHEWKPSKNYKSNQFTYDSITEEDAKREVNIDTDGDGLPDVNVDIDDDGIPDINIDGNGDEIPDVNIDSNGDGKPDYNIDVSGNGFAEENIIELKEWKPTQNAKAPYKYDTMEIPDPNESKEPTEEPQKPDQQGNNTDVKGYYYPGNSIGGAITGDFTNKYLYYASICLTLGMIAILIYKKSIKKQNPTNNRK